MDSLYLWADSVINFTGLSAQGRILQNGTLLLSSNIREMFCAAGGQGRKPRAQLGMGRLAASGCAWLERPQSLLSPLPKGGGWRSFLIPQRPTPIIQFSCPMCFEAKCCGSWSGNHSHCMWLTVRFMKLRNFLSISVMMEKSPSGKYVLTVVTLI